MDERDDIKNIGTKLKGFSTLSISTIVSNAIGGLFWLYIARVLGVNNYGEVSYLIAISTIVSGISIFGSGNSLIVYTAKQIRIEAVIYFLAILSSTIAAVMLYFIFQNVGVSLYVLGNTIFSLAGAYLIGKKSYKQLLIYSISQKVLGAIFAIVLNFYIGPNGVVLGLSISFFITVAKICQGFSSSKIDFSILRSRMEFILNNFMMEMARIFSVTLDKLLVVPILGYSLLGNYQIAVQFLSLMIMIPGIMYQYALSHDASGISTKKIKTSMIFFSIILTILGIVFAPFFINLLFMQFKESIQVFQIICLSIVPTTINFSYISKFLGSEKSRIILIGSGIYISIQVVLILILGRIMSLNGVAIAIDVSTVAETIYLLTINGFEQKRNQT